MSLTVAAFEHGLIRIFKLSPALHQLLKQADDLSPLEQALGVIIAKSEDVQIVEADTLTDMSLAQFLVAAYGVDQVETADITSTLSDTYAIVRSGAFGGAEVTLNDGSDAALLATLPEEGAALSDLTPLSAETAKGAVPPTPSVVKKPKSDARIGGMVATVVLLLMGLLVWLMIWIGG